MVKINFPVIVDFLDREHKDIELVLTQLLTDKEHTLKIRAILENILTDHFNHEEVFMKEISYPISLYEDHVTAHKHLNSFFIKYFKVAEEDPEHMLDLIELAVFLFASHINTSDALLSNWIAYHPISDIVLTRHLND
jgi:hemerythrin